MRKHFTSFILALLLLSFLSCSVGCTGGANSASKVQATPESPSVVAASIITMGQVEDDTMDSDDEALETLQYDGFDPDVDYMKIMAESCISGDILAGREASEARNKKIAALGLAEEMWDFDELYELAKIITNEAGSDWLSMEWKMKVGEVVLNRVASPEFPDTIYEVVHQKGQYDKANSNWFRNLVPYEDCVEAAVRLLNGERLLNDRTIVFQSRNRHQGSGVADTLKDDTGYYPDTYLCYTSYPELYTEEGEG